MNGIPSCRRALAGVGLPFLIEIGVTPVKLVEIRH